MDVNAIDLTGADLLASDLEVPPPTTSSACCGRRREPDVDWTAPRACGGCARFLETKTVWHPSVSEAPTQPHDEHLARVKSALIAEAAGRAGTRIEGLGRLFAVVDERWPGSHDNNKVVVTQPVAPETLLEVR